MIKIKIMKIKFQLLCVSLLLFASTCFHSCKKDSSSDPADQFVGSYSYTMTAPAFGTQTGNLTITKTAANKISMLSTGGTPTAYTIDSNNVTEDAGQIAEGIPVSGNAIANFTENSTGTLYGKVLTINGTWTNPKYTTLTFQVVAIIK